MKRAYVAAALALSGCAFADGEHFAELDPRLEVVYESVPGRDLPDGWEKLASDYEVRVTELVLMGEEIELLDSGGDALVFDPANPPPGYTLCHNGHCHSDSGDLVSYEDIQAELSGGQGASLAVVLPLPASIDVLDGYQSDLGCEPGCGLGLADIRLARFELDAVRVRGVVRDGRATPRIAGSLDWQLDLSPTADEELFILGGLELPADREHPPNVALALRLALSSRLLDAVAWDQIDDTGPALVLETDAAARAAILESITAIELGAEVSR